MGLSVTLIDENFLIVQSQIRAMSICAVLEWFYSRLNKILNVNTLYLKFNLILFCVIKS